MMQFAKTMTLLPRLKMNPFVDIIIIILFILFMVFVFGGYHKSKSIKREEERLRQEKKSDLENNLETC